MGDSAECGDGGWTPVMKIDGNEVGLLQIKTLLVHPYRKILPQYFNILRVSCINGKGPSESQTNVGYTYCDDDQTFERLMHYHGGFVDV